MLTCGSRTPVDCTAAAVRHVQLWAREGDRIVELVLCEAHFDEFEAEHRRDWHPIGEWCAYPWRKWDREGRQCVEDEDDDSVRYFTMEDLVRLSEDDPPHPPPATT